MKTIYCPNCDEPLPGDANFCAACGESLSSPGHRTARLSTDGEQGSTVTVAVKPSLQGNDSDPDHPVVTTPAILPIIEKHTPPILGGPLRPATVNVSRNSRMELVTTPSNALEEWDADPGGVALEETSRSLTWHKEVEPPVVDVSVSYLPRPRQISPVILAPQYPSRRVPPALFAWVSMIVLCLLTLAGVFGVSGSLGHGVLSTAAHGNLSLQVTPGDVAIGATMVLRGTNFSPNGRVGFTRDSSVPVADTGGKVVIQADNEGNFSDTVVVGQDWGVGAHTISAEDATTHKIASFPIQVGGQSGSLRPAHLALSTASLDLSSGDQATNSIRPLDLMNLGSGQVSWQASATQSWLQLSPISGTFSSTTGGQVMVAVDRANLKPGSYNAQINFSSNAGDGTLAVSMQVTPLKVDHQAVLQLSPAVLAFSAPDGSASTTPQVITVSNPGVLPLNWSVSSNVPWLTLSSQSGTITAGDNGQVKAQVDTSALLPGLYEGMITFSNQHSDQSDAVMHSPQSIYVSLTITPHCALEVSPGTLDFTSAYLQPAPPAKVISLSNTQSCAASVQWQAASDASWLNVSVPSGGTPSHPTINVNVAGLGPGVYHSSITFNSPAGTQVLPVSFTMGQPTTPIMAAAPAALSYSGVLGQGGPGGQTATISNTGGGVLHWKATATTTMGGNWLSVTPSSGDLGAHGTASISVAPIMLNSLSPGTYQGTITITGVDDAGNVATGNPQRIPISFVVKAPCTLSVGPTGLTFNGVTGGAAPGAQRLTFRANGGCANPLAWTASVSGGSWLGVTPASGSTSLSTAGTSNIGVSLTGLGAGTYHGTVTIKAFDSVTHAAIGQPMQVPVTLNVQQVCTLLAPSTNAQGFVVQVGSNPAPQTFNVSVGGACSGNVTITPSVSVAHGSGWLSVTPNPATVVTGGTATFTVQVKAAGLPAGHYTGTISLAATSGGNAIAGGTASVGITLDVQATPILTAGPQAVTINVTSGMSATQQVTVTNSGGAPLNWTAALDTNSPSFVSLSQAAGKNLGPGNSDTITITADPTNAQARQYTTNVVIKATDPATGKAVSSPVTIPITVNVAAVPAPAMQVSPPSVSLNLIQGTSSEATLKVANDGGGTLHWSATLRIHSGGVWATIALDQSTASGSTVKSEDAAGASTNLKITMDTTGLQARERPYTATLSILSTEGPSATVPISLTVEAPATSQSSATPSAMPEIPINQRILRLVL